MASEDIKAMFAASKVAEYCESQDDCIGCVFCVPDLKEQYNCRLSSLPNKWFDKGGMK